MSSSDKIVYAPRGESGHANSRKVRSTSPNVIASESYLPCSIIFPRGKNRRPTAAGSHSRASTVRDHLRPRATNFDGRCAFPRFRLFTRNVLLSGSQCPRNKRIQQTFV